MKKNNFTIIITTIVCLLPIVLSAILYEKLPEEIPIHFNVAGEADDYLPKAVATIGLPIGLALLNLLVHVVLEADPRKAGSSPVLKGISKWCIPIIAIIAMPISLFISLGYEIPIHIIISSLVGVLIMICGNYLPKTRQNYTMGIKLPWTLSNEENWNKTHRLAGILWILGGLLITVGGLLQSGGILFILMIATILVVIPFIYSFLLYKRDL